MRYVPRAPGRSASVQGENGLDVALQQGLLNACGVTPEIYGNPFEDEDDIAVMITFGREAADAGAARDSRGS